MPNIKSAKKRVLIIEKKTEENKVYITRIRNAIKKINSLIESNQIEEAEKLLPETMAVLNGAASKGIISKNNAANKISALSKRLSDIKSGKTVIQIKKDNKTIAAEKAKAAKEAREALRLEKAKTAAEKAGKKATEKAAAEKAKKDDAKEAPAKAKKTAKAEPAEKAEKTEKKAKAPKKAKEDKE